MLQQLSIHNYAIIKEVNIQFTNGFNIITGETGAGKSIILGALSLLLGDRADVQVLLAKDKKCTIEGVLTMPTNNATISQLLKEYNIDEEADIVIRRELAPNGKSRAFINDTPVNLTQLRQLSSLLIDLHQQFDNSELGEQDVQRAILDGIANTGEALKVYQKEYKQYNALKKDIALLQHTQQEAAKNYDYNKFLYNELADVNLQPNAIETSEAQLKTALHTENIKATLNNATLLLTAGEQPIIPLLKQLSTALKQISSVYPKATELQQRVHSCQLELTDIADELEGQNDALQIDEEKMAALTDVVNLGNKLLKKHQLTSTNQLIALKQKLEQELLLTDNHELLITKKLQELATLETNCTALAQALHLARCNVVQSFTLQINALLTQVGMPNASIQVQVTQAAQLSMYGYSSIQFLFDANRTGNYEPIAKVASGGELSRLMLCIKSLVADAVQLPILIFDEIDTGISGEAAKQVGIIMQQLALQHQVLCITHQAQIAAKATTHYYVYKTMEHDVVTTAIRVLPMQERVTIIAQMLSGAKPTQAALQIAKEMMN